MPGRSTPSRNTTSFSAPAFSHAGDKRLPSCRCSSMVFSFLRRFLFVLWRIFCRASRLRFSAAFSLPLIFRRVAVADAPRVMQTGDFLDKRRLMIYQSTTLSRPATFGCQPPLTSFHKLCVPGLFRFIYSSIYHIIHFNS